MPVTPAITPYITVDDAAKAIAFYKEAFGAVEVMRMPATDGKRLMHAALTINGCSLLLSDDFPEMNGGKGRSPKALGGTPVTIHLTVPDVDAVWARAIAAGATVVHELAQQFWGDRYGVVTDPFGHSWSMATPGQPVSHEDMQRAMKDMEAGGK